MQCKIKLHGPDRSQLSSSGACSGGAECACLAARASHGAICELHLVACYIWVRTAHVTLEDFACIRIRIEFFLDLGSFVHRDKCGFMACQHASMAPSEPRQTNICTQGKHRKEPGVTDENMLLQLHPEHFAHPEEDQPVQPRHRGVHKFGSRCTVLSQTCLKIRSALVNDALDQQHARLRATWLARRGLWKPPRTRTPHRCSSAGTPDFGSV